MGIKKGYKVTELGIIPEDWEVKELGLVLLRTRLGGNYPNQDNESDYPLMKMGNIARGVFEFSKIEYIKSGIIPENFHILKYGDILFNTRNTLDLVGKVAIWRNELPIAYYNSNLLLLEFDKNEISSNEYANYALNSFGSVTQLRSLATGTTSVAAIYSRDLMNFLIIVPTKEEQTAIANALSDVDALIDSLDKLIEKKKNIKQGTMQELLTGKTRLPGFQKKKGFKQTEVGTIPEDWEECFIEDIAKISTGSKNTQDRIEEGEFPFFVRSQTIERINSYSFDTEAVLTAGDGVGTGKVFHYIKGKFEVHQRVYVIFDFNNADGAYFFLYFSKNFYNRIMQMTAKSSVDSVRRDMIARMKIPLPPTIEEQTAIATVLSDMDSEIEALEKQKQKTVLLKQGMMQELLTGKTRLV